MEFFCVLDAYFYKVYITLKYILMDYIQFHINIRNRSKLKFQQKRNLL